MFPADLGFHEDTPHWVYLEEFPDILEGCGQQGLVVVADSSRTTQRVKMTLQKAATGNTPESFRDIMNRDRLRAWNVWIL